MDISIEVVASACLGHNGLIPDEAVVALPRWLTNGFPGDIAPKEQLNMKIVASFQSWNNNITSSLYIAPLRLIVEA